MNFISDNFNVKPVSNLTSIVILMHNQIEYTKRCLDSILLHTKMPFELILVDNGSSDGTGAYLRTFAEEIKIASVHIINNNENLGFAAGNNQGIAAAHGEYILLLNNDTIVTEGWLEGMIACAKAHPKAGIVGPMSNKVIGPQLVRNADYNTQTAGGLSIFAKRFADDRKGRAHRVLRVVGFCMLIKREVIDKIGGLDECFGKGNLEDDDFCLRVALAGFDSWVAEDCFIHHFGSRTFAGAHIDNKTSLLTNWEIFKKKWGIPQDQSCMSGYNLSQINSTAFDPLRHYIPLPGPTSVQEEKQGKDTEGQENPKSKALEENIFNIIDHARGLAHRGHADKAVNLLLKGIKTCRGDKRIYRLLAEILINEKKYNDALEILDRFPAEADELKRLEYTGYCREALGQDDEAEGCIQAILALDNDWAAAWFLKGTLALKKGQDTAAEEYLLRAIKSDETFGPAYSCLGLLKKNQGIENQALDLLEKGFILCPTDTDILTEYHREARAQKAFERAEQAFRDALERHPGHRLIHFQVIDLLLRQERLDAAMEEIEKAISDFGIDDGLVNAALSVRKRLGPKEIKDPAGKNGTISLCMIVKDEEGNIPRCLTNLRPLADEMIVVDTGSSDRTKTLAEIFGAKVYDFTWNNDFSAARNYSISKASGDWILVMDADEAISPDDFDDLRKTLQNNRKNDVAFSFVTRNYIHTMNAENLKHNDGTYGNLEMGYGWVPSEKTRLFRNSPHIRFEYPVHEVVEPSLIKSKNRISKCHVPIHHYGKLNNAKSSKKADDYFNLGIKKLEDSSDNPQALYELAVQAAELEKCEEAVDLWERYLRLHPENPSAYINMGKAFFQMGKIKDAIATTKAAMALDPTRDEASCNYALYEIYNGNAATAIPALQRLVKRSSKYTPGRLNLAVAYTCIGRRDDAKTIHEELEKTIGVQSLVKAYLKISKRLFKSGQTQYAASMFKTAGSLIGKSHEVRGMSQDIYSVYDKPESTDDKPFSQRRGKNTEDISWDCNDDISEIIDHAHALACKGQVEKAINGLLKGIKISRKDKRLCTFLGKILINEGRYNEALQIIDMISADTDETTRLELTGYCKEALGLDGEAETCINRMLSLDINSAPGLYLKGKLALKKGALRDAEKYLLRAIKANDTFGPAYSCLGLLKKIEGAEHEALDLLEKGFMLCPTDNKALTEYHREARAQKAFERAEEVFRGALERHPGHRLIHFQVIDLLLRQERFEASMEEIERAISDFGSDDGLINAALSVRKRLGPKEIKDPAGKNGTISLCMIVKDEEGNIPRCLTNLRPLADEMIVVDTGSSDRTKALAEIFGAKVYDFAWDNDFSAARNYSLSKAAGDWILVMDADEVISPKDFDALKKAIRNNKKNNTALSFVTRNYHTRTNLIGMFPNDGIYKEEAGYGWIGSDKVRLFKNRLSISFEYPVHEAVEPSLRRNRIQVRKCAIPVHHYGKLDYKKDLKKGESYYYLGREKLERSPDNAKAIFELAIQAGGLEKWEESIELWQRYNTLSPGNPIAYTNMGNSYLRLGRFDAAIESTKTAMDLDPDMNDAISNYALYHILSGEAEKAVNLLEKLEQRCPDYYSARFKLASAYACVGRKEDALRLLNKLNKTPIGPTIKELCGLMIKELYHFGQTSDAEAMNELTDMFLKGGL